MPEKLTMRISGLHRIELITAANGSVLRLTPENGEGGVSIGLDGYPAVSHTELRPWLQPRDVPPAIEEKACPAN